jgi:hypothetical protein
VKDSNAICYVPSGVDQRTGDALFTLSGVTNALIWGTMHCDLTEITEKNLDEWMFRILCYQEIGVQWCSKVVTKEDGTQEYEKFMPGYKDLRSHIGLRTNAGNESRTKFLNKIKNRLVEEVEYRLDLLKYDDKLEQEGANDPSVC